MESSSAATGARTLRVLDKRDVQRICSGQSVVDLATAVKEMVENALDAGATLIEVKLKEFGKETIEVSDNGSGIAPLNYDTIALKHYTSKISRFEDIETVASFGFRGEALSSVCQLVSSFSVCTRTKDEEIGAFLEFDGAGKLVRQTPKARPVGTTVIVEELFKPLAVRHKDFHRNIKKHYGKLLKVLQAYAVSSTNVKICVYNATGKNAARQVVLSTQAHQSMGDNIASVFGTKFVRTLTAVDIDLTEACQRIRAKQRLASSSARGTKKAFSSQDEDLDDDDDDGGKQEDDSDGDDMSASQLEKKRQVVGYVSKVGTGTGRSDNDRQFFFINGRPFDLPKVAKALNEVWRQYEMKQKPVCVLNFLLPLGEYDVNVTPDKRETFIKHEAEVIEAFKIQLNKLYEPTRGTFTVQPLLSSFARVSKKTEEGGGEPKPSPASPLPSSSPKELQETISSSALQDEEPMDNDSRFQGQTSIIRPQSVADANVGGGGASYHSVSPEKVHAVIVEVLSPKKRRPSTDDVSSSSATEHHQSAQISITESHSTDSSAGCCSSSSPHHSNGTHGVLQSPVVQEIVQQPRAKKQKVYRDDKDSELRSGMFRDSMQASEWSFSEMKKQRKQFFEEEVEDELERRKRMNRLKVPKTCSAGGDDTENGTSNSLEVDNEVAAAALQRVLKKDDFKRMQVLGQFNLGFIIGKLDDDMFIIDQHASDEKFNYETLQQTTVLHQQPLVRPLPLELTAGEEMVVMDHLDVFAKNGFTFLVNKEAAATKKLKLLSLPFTKQTQFGVEDIRELASLLMDAPMNASSIRLPKIMAMFASRACRSSIMIGTALHKEEMQKIVRNLSGLEQPWNCPHGRPTLRHLLDLRQLEDKS